jgi:hypothetical protein
MAVVTEVQIPGSYIAVFPDGTTGGPYTKSSARYFYDRRPERSRERKPSGWLYPTSYNLEVQSRSQPLGWLQRADGIRMVGYIPYVDQNVPAFSHLSLPSTAEDEAITKALLQLKDQNVNYGVAIAEAQATANLVGTAATSLARSVQALRRRDLSGAFNHLGLRLRDHRGKISSDIPKAWLQMQYGWKPLLSDVHGAIQDLCFRSANPPLWRQTVKGSVQNKDSGSETYVEYFGSKTVSFNKEAGCFVRLDYQPGNTFLSAMSRSGVTNPAEVIWEVVPFSFVADWFIPVGDYLSTLDADAGWIFLSGSATTFYRTKCFEAPGPPSGGYAGGNFSGKFSRVSLDRRVYSDSPSPSFPRFKNPWSTGHLANGLALISSIFK